MEELEAAVRSATKYLEGNGYFVRMQTHPAKGPTFQVKRATGQDVNFHPYMSQQGFLEHAQDIGWDPSTVESD